METFETLLARERPAILRYVRFRLGSGPDAEDVLQEICLTAYQKFPQLQKSDAFKAWLVSIARNKCNDYFRGKAGCSEISVERLPLMDSRYGRSEVYAVRQTLEQLGQKDQQILYLSFWSDLPQAEIAKSLGISLGTVKSRLHRAKQNFKNKYPYPPRIPKGDRIMKKLPKILPDYTIEPSEKTPFSVIWEELMGWFLVPKLGEKRSWGMYDIPSRQCSHIYDMQVTGKAKVHGIEGVELTAREAAYSDPSEAIHRTFIAQLTQTHCRYLASFRNDGDIRNYITFLDGEEFLLNWGFGEDNCGNEINLSAKGDIQRQGNVITTADKPFLLDVVGRYTVTLGGKAYDTVCVMDIETYNSGVVSEQFLDKNGRTILWRRFNRDDWALERYGKPWSQQLPENERLKVNGQTYVHWYDCVTDYIF